MLAMIKICFLIHLYIILIECLVPGYHPELSVRKLDQKLIDRKRQDTMDMCRIFTEETKKLEEINQITKHKNKKTKHRRAKRELRLQDVNPALNLEDAQRVENIVDKIYDDLQERGEMVDYRRGDVSAFMNFSEDTPITSGRRFDFAPASLLGPQATKAPFKDTDLPPAASKTPRFKHGIVPYFIDSKTYDAHLAEVIMKAFDYFEKVTCIRLQRLRERPTDRESLQKVEWLYITNPTGIRQCVHSNDRTEIKGVQMIVFGYDCMSLGDITHEVMHVLGFSHEHVRPDRDQYVTIVWDNIKPGYKKYFELLAKPVVENLPYDYASVLHYPPRAFSRNGQVTIMTQPGVKIGQREGLSEMDVEKISVLYSTECVKRNREYLLSTCPGVVKTNNKPVNATKKDIEKYYEKRLWSYAIVNYKLRDKMEFSNEEIENINAVIRHIEKETCIEFRDLTLDPLATIEVEEVSSETRGSDNNDKAKHSQGSDSKTSSREGSQSSSTKLNMNNNKQGTGDEIDQILTDKDSSGSDNSEYEPTKGSSGHNKLSDESDINNEVSRRYAKNFLRKKKSVEADKKAQKTVKKRSINETKSNDAQKIPASPSRRHATNILILTRSAQPGCECPPPGVPGTVTTVTINADCFNSVNDLLHLFVHILGLEHQHNSYDRDSYLHIVWEQLTDNIRADMQKKLPPAASVGFPYDYQSVMHYPWLQIKNGRTNIMYPIWNDGWAMGHWQGLSSIDVQKLNLLYYKQCVLRRKQADEAELRMRTTAE